MTCGSPPGPMTPRAGAPSVIAMRNKRLSTHTLIAVALTAVFSLAAAHLVDLGSQVLGSGGPSAPALVGDAVGLVACAVSAWYGLRRLRRPHVCGSAADGPAGFETRSDTGSPRPSVMIAARWEVPRTLRSPRRAARRT